MKEYDDQVDIEKFNPFFEDDEVINTIDEGFFSNPFDTIQTIPDFELANSVIQDPFIEGFIPPSTEPFSELGADKTGTLGKIGYDDDIKKTDEREGDLEDDVTGNPILVVPAGEDTQFTLIENNQSPDKYNWIVKESGTINPRVGSCVNFTAPGSVPTEPIKLYLFSEQNQLDYVQIEIETQAATLYVSVTKEGYTSYGFIWNVVDGIMVGEIGVGAGGTVVGKELFQVEESSTDAMLAFEKIPDGDLFKWGDDNDGGLSGILSEPSSCPGIDDESLFNNWDVYQYWTDSITYWKDIVTVHNAQEHFNSYKLTALNDSGYAGAAKTYIYGYYEWWWDWYGIYPTGEIFNTNLTIKTPIGEMVLDVLSAPPYFPYKYLYEHTGKSNILGQYTDTIISQCYIYQTYYTSFDFPDEVRHVSVLAQASIVENGNDQTPRGLERTTALETAVKTLISTWYEENGFGDTDIEDLTITWELIE